MNGEVAWHAWWRGWCRGKSWERPPWQRDGITIYMTGGHLCGHARKPWEVYPHRTGIMPWYHWVPDEEPHPGWELWTMLQKPVSKGDEKSQEAAWSPSPLDIKELPTLVEYMSQRTWPDGTSRVTSTVTIFCDRGKWKVSVRDRDGGKVLFVTSPDLTVSLAAANAALRAPNPDWRDDKDEADRKGKKK